ncbi:DUF3284 domain-containing protein [Globicatella sanguinis]
MEVAKVLNVPIEDVFDAITLSFKQDYYANTDIELNDDEIVEGLTYIKTFGRNNQNSIRLTVKEFVRPTHYCVVYGSNQGKQEVQYQLRSITDRKTEVTYIQVYEPSGFFHKANAWIMDKVFAASVKKKIKAQLTGLESFAKTTSKQINTRK